MLGQMHQQVIASRAQAAQERTFIRQLRPGAERAPAAANAMQLKIGIELLAHIPSLLYGILIIGFLLFEPLGLAKIYANLRNYLIFWPFGYERK